MTTKTTTDKLIFKNQQTGKREDITQYDMEVLDWGFHFFVKTEAEAYRAAYLYRYNAGGVKVEYAQGGNWWMVTVFNAAAVEMKLDGADRRQFAK